MLILFKAFLLLVSIALLTVGIMIKFTYLKKNTGNSLKNKEKYVNYFSLLYISTSILWIILTLLNIFSIYMILPLVLIYFIEKKYGKKEKKKSF